MKELAEYESQPQQVLHGFEQVADDDESVFHHG
jgi:hypothetical protein